MNDETIHHIISDTVPMVVIVTMTIGAAWVLSLIIQSFRQRALLRAQTEFHNKMLEKFGTAEEFTAYLQSDAGKSFFDNLLKEPSTPLSKILGSIQKGAILTLLGLGFFIINNIFDTLDSRNIMLVIATVSMTIGIGFLVSSLISYRLAKSWGLISAGNSPISNAPKTVAP